MIWWSDHHWFRWWLVAWSAPSHYLNQCWIVVKWTLRNKLHLIFNRNFNIFIQENAFESVVCEIAILSRPQCVNSMAPDALAPCVTIPSLPRINWYLCLKIRHWYHSNIRERNIKAMPYWPFERGTTGGFPSQRVSNTECLSVLWYHYNHGIEYIIRNIHMVCNLLQFNTDKFYPYLAGLLN